MGAIVKNGIVYGGSISQEQANWTESDVTSPAYIQNKPTLGTASAKDSTTTISDGGTDLPTSGAVYTALQNVHIDVDTTLDTTSNNPIANSAVATALNGKVDAVNGKGLSTNDYTDAEQTKLSGIATGAEVNVQANWTESDTDSDAYIQNKPTLGTAASKDSTTSITQNSNDLITSGAVYTGLSGKVDTVSGKGLSTNDYTTEEKNKLSGIATGAEVNVQANWNETSSSSDAYIQNKPTKVSDFTNDSGFITNTVNNLTNYYTTSNTYTKTEVDNLISAAKNGRFVVVATLPTTDIQTNVIYLLPKTVAQTDNVYDEYINTDGTSAGWEKIGDTQIDLSNYIQGSGTSGYIAKFDGTRSVTNGPAFGSATNTYLRNDGTWQTPPNDNTTYSLAAGSGDDANKIVLTPSSGSAQKVTVPYASNAGTVNGKTVAENVPSGAKFTDTTYTGSNGVSLSGTTFSNSGVRFIAEGATNGTINVNTNGSTADVAVHGLGSLAYKSSVSKSDVGLGNVANIDQSKAISSITRSGTTFTATALDGSTTSFTQQDNNTTYSDATTTTSGLMSASDKVKLNGIATGAEVNQNAFSRITVGSTNIDADTKSDALTLVAGTNVTLTPDATNDKVTIAATDTTYTGANGVSLSGTTFSNSGVRSIATGTSDGTINVNTNGSTANVAVKGLGAMAYKASVSKTDVGLGNVANYDQSKAITSITRSGTTFTATALDGSTTSFTQQDNNTWTAMVGATSAANGSVGYVNAVPPKDGYNTKYLRADGTWTVPPDNNTTYTGANGVSLSGTTFSNSGVRSIATGTSDGTINVNTNGSTANVAVKGLGAMAYKASVSKSDVGLGNVANYDQSKAIKTITRNGTTFTATAIDGSTTSFTQQDNNTTYSNATTAAAGLMSASDKVKLNGISTGANKITKTRYTISSSSWSSTKTSGYYTYSVTLNPTLNTSYAPTIYLTGSGDNTFYTTTEKEQYALLDQCNLTASNTLVLYAETKPTGTFYIYIEGQLNS